MSVNKAIIVGRVGQDPEVKAVGESKVANFSLATTEKYKDNEKTEWHNIVIWGKLADIVEKYVTKGMQLYIEGSITTRSWDDNGVTKYKTEIKAYSMQMLGGKGDGIQGNGSSSNETSGGYSASAGDGSDDDLPF